MAHGAGIISLLKLKTKCSKESLGRAGEFNHEIGFPSPPQERKKCGSRDGNKPHTKMLTAVSIQCDKA
jgi:hypothetical protein